VSLDAASKRWRLASPGVSVVDAREGVIGSAAIASYSWAVPAGHASAFVPIAMRGNRAIAVEPRPDLMAPFTDSLGGLMFVLASTPRWRSTIWALGPEGAVDVGTSRLELACQPLRSGGACEIFDASRTRFFTLDAGTRGFTISGSLPGRFFAGGEAQGAWLTGWYQSTLVAVRLAPADAIRVAGPGGDRPHMLAASDHAAAGVWYQAPVVSGLGVDATSPRTATSLIRVYAIE
jgi:hypothetical protein